MVKLTEEMIVARTRVSDMANVKKLNCWGAELTDITVLRKLVNVEVLSLSVNCIATLSDIQNCKNLQELYIRKNKIPDLSEICWLRDLPKLKSLWLEENPCVQDHGELYRVTVIRNLPQLQKLDNIAVQPDELADAMRRGMELIHPLEREPVMVAYPSMPLYQPQSLVQPGGRPSRDAVPRSPDKDRFSPNRDEPASLNRRSSSMTQEQSHTPSRRVSNQSFESTAGDGSPYRTSPGRQQMVGYSSRRSSSYAGAGGMDDHGFAVVQHEGGGYAHVPEFHTGRRYSQQEVGNVRRSPRVSQVSMDEGARRMSIHDSAYEDERNANSYALASSAEPSRGLPRNSYHPSSTSFPSAPEMGQAPFAYPSGGYYEYSQKGNQPQNSNILSAVLCLIKELDGPSLEVAEMAVRCRMEELED